MMGNRLLDRLIQDVMYSGYVTNVERPISLLMVAQPGLGKSQTVMQYGGTQGIVMVSDITFARVMQQHWEEMAQGNVKHLVLPDLGTLINKPKEYALQQLSLFGSLIEEGITEVSSMRASFKSATPVRCGIIACVTQFSFREKLRFLGDEGFLSRFLIASYSHPASLQSKIHESMVKEDENPRSEPRRLRMPTGKIYVELPDRIGEAVMREGWINMVKDSSDTAGYRAHKNLRNLLRANALRNRRTEVQKEDFWEIDEIIPYLGDRMKALEDE